MYSRPCSESHALERSDGGYEISDRNRQRRCQNCECSGARDNRASLDLSERYAREPSLCGEFLLGQLPIQPQPGDVCGDAPLSGHSCLSS